MGDGNGSLSVILLSCLLRAMKNPNGGGPGRGHPDEVRKLALGERPGSQRPAS